MLLDGENTIVLRAVSNSGPNIDSIEVFPHDDREIGSAFVDVDNEYSLYIDGHLVGSGSQWDSTDACQLNACFKLTVSNCKLTPVNSNS